MTTTTQRLSDWALIQQYVSECSRFIDPFLFNALRGRGLVWVVDGLQGSVEERKAAAYGKLLRAGKVFGDEQIDGVAAHIERVKELQKLLAHAVPTDTARLLEWSAELTFHAQAQSAFFRS